MTAHPDHEGHQRFLDDLQQHVDTQAGLERIIGPPDIRVIVDARQGPDTADGQETWALHARAIPSLPTPVIQEALEAVVEELGTNPDWLRIDSPVDWAVDG